MSAAWLPAAFARGAFPILLDTALKGAALIVAAAAIAWLLRRRAAAARHAAWTAAVVAHLALPVLTLMVPGWQLPFLPAPPWLEAAAAPLAPSAGVPPRIQSAPDIGADRNPHTAGDIHPLPASAPTAPGSAAPRREGTPTPVDPPDRVAAPRGTVVRATATSTSSTPSTTPPPDERGGSAPGAAPAMSVAALLWAAGAALVLLRLAIGTWSVGRLASDGARVDDGAWLSLAQRVAGRLGVARPLTLLRGRQLAVPVTWGVVYPVVLLPPDADAWPEERRRFVLVHEMAHVQRFDALTQLAAQVALALFWFDPLLWYATHRMRVEREQACDDAVLRDGTAPSLYAGELLDMVRSIGSRSHARTAPAFAALAMARTSEFEGRMLAILDPHHDRHPLTRRGTLMTSLFVALLAVPLAALRPFEQPARPAQSTTPAASSGGSAPSTPSRPGTASRPGAPAAPTASTAATTTEPASPMTPASPRSTTASASSRSGSTSGASCNSNFRGTSISVHSDSDDEREQHVEYVQQQDGRCVEARITGAFVLTPDETDVASIGRGDQVYLRERRPEVDREVRIFMEGGALRHEAIVDGQPAEYDAAARAWVAAFLPEVVREAGIDAPRRVARIRAAGGVSAVLAEIARIHSSGAKRTYFEALLDEGKLSADEIARVTERAGRDISSSGDLSAVLRKVPGGSNTPAGRAAFAEALDRVSSSGDRRETIAQLAPTADREMLLVLAHAASGITSSGDRSEFLRNAASYYLTKKDGALRTAWFDVARTVPSSGDLAEVLRTAIPYAHADAEVARLVMVTVDSIASSGDKAEVLIAAASQRLLTTRAVRDAYLAAAQHVASSGDRARVLDAALAQP